MQLNTQIILDKATEILSDYGLGDLTMRRLARTLDVVPGALYWHYPSKQDLLGAIALQLLNAVPTPDSADVRAQEYCVALYEALTTLRDGADITLTAIASHTVERDIVAELDCLAPHKGQILYHYVFGAALDFQAKENVALALGKQDENELVSVDIRHGVAMLLQEDNR
ncbi:TetR family transcriptional regulator [Corynebacterium sp. 4HC-13]|uniref:TetR/AcrR family transcriptional regulator n=1 Tax=Corynebacterium anserum TaxID=2684406 RepID=UPI00163AE192|nr:helix-turn-helix domain-containing protein [Corynebacterium anserum]MBC2680881.1 TetR family transcriptional regulator [Corynebacterium anserum]